MNSSSRLDRRRRRRSSACDDDDDDDDDFFDVNIFLVFLLINECKERRHCYSFLLENLIKLLKKNERICHALCFPRHRGNIFY
jgi:hypothetical protein